MGFKITAQYSVFRLLRGNKMAFHKRGIDELNFLLKRGMYEYLFVNSEVVKNSKIKIAQNTKLHEKV